MSGEQAPVPLLQECPQVHYIAALKDRTFGFQLVTPMKLLVHFKEEVESVDIISVMGLIKERNAPLDFEGDLTTAQHFKYVDELAIIPRDDHKIITSL